MEKKDDELISNHEKINKLISTVKTNSDKDQTKQQLISELIQTADPLLSIQKERKNAIIQNKLPIIYFLSFYPKKSDDFLIPITMHFMENPDPSVLSIFTLPTSPFNIYFECSDSNILEQNLILIQQLADMQQIHIQQMIDMHFIHFFCNFNILSYLRNGSFVEISNPEFKGNFGQIISTNNEQKKCLLKLIPRIDYDNLNANHLVSQSQLNSKMPPDYQPPKSLFDKDKLIQINSEIDFQTKIIDIRDVEFKLTIWDEKLFYDNFQYKPFDIAEVKTIHEDIPSEEYELFTNNISPKEKELFENPEKVYPIQNFTQEQDNNHKEEINPIIEDDEQNDETSIENDSKENSTILSDIPKRFPQVSILTNYITLKVPIENFVWLEKTDGVHNNIIIEKNQAYSIINGAPKPLSTIELNGPEFEKRSILDTEYYNDKYYIFDAAMLEGEDISTDHFKERMTKAQEFISKSHNPNFIMKEYYELTSWKDVIQFVDENVVSPITGNRIDGVVCQRTDKSYYCTPKDPSSFKLKRKVMITNDFYVRYQSNEKRFYLYLIGNYKNFIFNLKQLPKKNKYMKAHTGVDPNSRQLPDSFYILFSSPYEEHLHVFKPRTYWSRNGYFQENIDEIDQLMNEIIKNPSSFDEKLIEMSLADDGWVPLRIRNDKVKPNGYSFGVANSSIIFAPVTGEESYFSKKFFFDSSITDPYHKINQIMRKYIIEHSINTLNNPRLNVLDLAGGRGADLLSLFHSGAFNIFAVDADRNALVQYVTRSNNIPKTQWEKLRKNSVDLAKNRKTFSLNAVYAMLGKNNTKFITDIKSRFEYPRDGFDVILMNYAIHYLCYSHECIKQLNKFVKSLLKHRGLFIFSCFDGDLILDDMRRNPKNGEIELALNSFNIKLIKNVNELDVGLESDSDAKWANMALPTIDATGYRPEPLVQRRWLRDLNLRTIEHYYPLRRCEEYIKDIENKEKVVDYLDYIQVYVMEK